jgi:hypothetical protein
MDAEMNGNGAVYVQVPSLKIGELRAEVASEMLSLWHERLPNQFGQYLAEVMAGAKVKPVRSS